MLHITKVLSLVTDDIMNYRGEKTGYLYTINIIEEENKVCMAVEDLDEDGNPVMIFDSSFYSLSAAIAKIEAIENGEDF